MLIFKTVMALREWLKQTYRLNNTIGFVPTMGALHEGHISLIQASKENDITVCSIFVNPTQFNDPSDLAKYPRTYDADVRLLSAAQTDILFFPSVDEIYPPDLKPIKVDLLGLDLMMEGAQRPGHFQGVVQVVYRLLDIIKPTRVYMGQKDFQQFTIVGQMIHYLSLPVQLIICPIAREDNGLAMSSRNRRLSVAGRLKAGLIYQVLLAGKKMVFTHSPAEIEEQCLRMLQAPGFTPEYFSVVDSQSLMSIHDWTGTSRPVACLAVWLEGVRLIDNEYFR